jgi:hypothetical protein
MRQTTYRLTLDNGLRVDIEANSASEAIEKALRENLDRTVAECYSGLTEEDAETARMTRDKKAIAGLITFDVPPHVAYTKANPPPKRTRHQDDTIPLFGDRKIEGVQPGVKAKPRYE